MGADMSEFELEESVKQELEVVNKEETLNELFNRTMKSMTDVLFQPERYAYSAEDLTSPYISEKGFLVHEFNMQVDGLKLHGAKWVRNVNSNICILYLHTNSRSVVDATEVIPLASVLDANVLSYDMPGSGKSDGHITLSGTRSLEAIVQYIIDTNPDIEIILWARAISTQLAIEFMSSFHAPPEVKFLVLDTPFASVEDIVMEAAAKIPVNGITIPSVFIKFAVSVVRKSIKEQIGTDPYTLKPIKCVKYIQTPCFILTADDDPYVSESMSARVVKAFKSEHCWHREFPGSYFDTRDHCIVLSPLGHILKYVSALSRSHSRSRSGSGSSSALSTGNAATPIAVSAAVQGSDRSVAAAATVRDVLVDISTSDAGGNSSSSHDIKKMDSNYSMDSNIDTLLCSPADKLLPSAAGIDIVIHLPERRIATWTPDEKMPKCGLCRATFGVVRFRHHCRNCGNCLCETCSSTKKVLIHIDMHAPVRICDACVDMKRQEVISQIKGRRREEENR